MGAGRVVVDPPLLDQHPGFGQCVEHLAVKQFIAQLAVDGVDGPRS